MDLPRISVVTPCLNHGEYILECIESVVSQRYGNLEYIVIDGGSKDETVSIIKRHESFLHYWVSEPDRGQSDAINKGLRRATGDLVAWLNADDYYLPGALREVAMAFQGQPNAPFYFGNGFRVDKHGSIKQVFFPDGPLIFNRGALLYGLNYLLQPATFINRARLEKSGLLDVTLNYGMDSDLWMRLSRDETPVAVSKTLAASREYEATKTATGMFERIEELRQISRRHTGAEMTPGVLCYFLDTLHRYSTMREDLFDEIFRRTAVEPMWQDTASLLARHSASPEGFPCPPDDLPPLQRELGYRVNALEALRRRVIELEAHVDGLKTRLRSQGEVKGGSHGG